MSVGFQRKSYVEIIEDMQGRAREVFGENINLSDSSPLGMYIQVIAWEISIVWDEIERSHYAHYAQWATDQDLDNLVSNFGRKRSVGTKAIVEVEFKGSSGVIIPEGFSVSTSNGLVFETVKELVLADDKGSVSAQALYVGTEYNIPIGSISEIVNPLSGVKEVINRTEALGGSGVETDDDLRERHLLAVREPATGDNIAQYRQWASEVNGVGNVRVLPTTPKAGFVTLIIADSDGKEARQEIVTATKDHIDSVRPVNAGVYVESATKKSINVNVSIKIADGYQIQDVRPEIYHRIESYLVELALTESYVSFARVGKILLDIAGIADYSDLLLNGVVGNVELDDREVAILDDITLEVL